MGKQLLLCCRDAQLAVILCCVGRVAQWIIFHGHSPDSIFDISLHFDHGITESINFFFGLALGRFHHQSSRDWEGHCRSVEPVVNESLSNIINAHEFGMGINQDAFMGYQTVLARNSTG